VGEILHNFGTTLQLTCCSPANWQRFFGRSGGHRLVTRNERVLKDPAPAIGIAQNHRPASASGEPVGARRGLRRRRGRADGLIDSSAPRRRPSPERLQVRLSNGLPLVDGRPASDSAAARRHLRGAFAAPALELTEPLAALAGGFDTEIYALRLRDRPRTSPARSRAGLLRSHQIRRGRWREQARRTRSPRSASAPRVLLAAEAAALGAPFVLKMDGCRGRPPARDARHRMGAVLADLQCRLHALDPAPLSRALGARERRRYLDDFAGRIERAKLDELGRCSSGCARAARRPPRRPICHATSIRRTCSWTMAA